MTEPYGVGTVSVANGGTTVTGTSTFWVGKVRKNDLFTVPAQGLFARVTADPTENDELAINGWPGTDLVDAEYEIISTYIAVDTASRTRELLLGLSLIDPNYDAQVADLAGRAAYDDKPGPTPTERGFAVLVSDIGDGRSAIYSKVSNASADWSDAAYFSGPTGSKGWSPQLVAESDGERRVLKLAGYVGGEGTEPTDNVGEYLKADGTFTATIGDAVDIRGEGFVFRGAYGSGTTYAKNDVAREAGSSWILTAETSTGNAPPALPTTSNAYWELLAQKGNDGAGTGDVVGPASSTAKRLAVFANLTGKLLAEASGLTAAEQGQARADIDASALTGIIDLIINGMGQVNQRVYTTVADDVYWCDRHYILTQTAAITPTILADVASGLPSMMRLSQSQATAQRMGNAQIVEAALSKPMRGKKATLAGKLRCSSAQAIRFAILEWTGTADTVTSDVVNSWTNGTFTAGQFFLGSGLTVAGVGTLTPAAATLTDFELVVDVSASCNNLIVFIWTEGTAAQNVTLDHAWNLLPGDWSAGGWPYVNPRHPQQEAALCERYFRFPALNGAGWWNDTTNSYFGVAFSPPMRSTPNVGTPTGNIEELGASARAASAAFWSVGQTASGGLLRVVTSASAGNKIALPSSLRVPFDAEL